MRQQRSRISGGMALMLAVALGSTGSVGAAAAPWGITVDAGKVLRVDLVDGESTVLTDLGDASFTLYSLASDGSGTWYGLTGEDGDLQLHRVAGGLVTPVGSLGSGSGEFASELGPDGVLYFASGAMLFSVDPGTAQLTAVLPLAAPLIALATAESTLYGLRRVPGQLCALEQIDLDQGTVTTVQTRTPCGHDLAALGPDVLIVSSWNPIMGVYMTGVERLDVATGESEWIGTWGNEIGDPVWKTRLPSLTDVTVQGGGAPVEVPAVGAVGLAALGLALGVIAIVMLGAARRRTR